MTKKTRPQWYSVDDDDDDIGAGVTGRRWWTYCVYVDTPQLERIFWGDASMVGGPIQTRGMPNML